MELGIAGCEHVTDRRRSSPARSERTARLRMRTVSLMSAPAAPHRATVGHGPGPAAAAGGVARSHDEVKFDLYATALLLDAPEEDAAGEDDTCEAAAFRCCCAPVLACGAVLRAACRPCVHRCDRCCGSRRWEKVFSWLQILGLYGHGFAVLEWLNDASSMPPVFYLHSAPVR